MLETKYGKLISFAKYDDFASFPAEGTEQVIYRDIAMTNTYMWDTDSLSYINLAGIGAPTLQQVTDEGSITTHIITAGGFNLSELTGIGIQSLIATTTSLKFERSINTNSILFTYPTTTTNHQANLNFAGITGTKTITFQNLSGTVAYLSDVVAAGAQTLQQVATLGNTFTGNLVLAGITIGRGGNPTLNATLRSTAVGDSALAFNMSTDNSALGYHALGTNLGGTWNTAIGSEALALNTTGNGNTAIGYQALKANLTGGDNTAIGLQALAANLASNNVAIGLWALKSNTTGAGNLSIGRSSLETNMIGSNNVGIGLNTLRASSSGESNIAIGYGAMSIASSSIGYNIGIGVNAISATTGSNNIALGLNVGNNLLNGSNNILIGQVVALTTTINNSLNIQNIIFGINNGTTGSGISTGNIGIGITSPARKLDVGGSLGFTGALFVNSSSGTSGQILVSQGAGAPIWQDPTSIVDSTAWHKTGDAGTDSDVNFIGTTDTKSLVFKVNNTRAGIIAYSQNSTSFGYNALNPLETGGNNTAIGKNALAIVTSGAQNVAIGVSTLNLLLSGNFNTGLGNSSLLNATTGSSNTGLGASALNTITTGSNNVGIGYQADVANATGSGQLSIQNIIYGTGNTGTQSTISTGNIGIGVKAPAYKLEVAGTLGVSGIPTFTSLSGTGTRIVLAEAAGTLTTSTLTPNSVPYIDAIGSYVTSPFFTYDGSNMNVGDGNLASITGLILNSRGKLQASVAGFNLRLGGNDFQPVDISKSFKFYNQNQIYFTMGSSSTTSHYAFYTPGLNMTFNGDVSFNNNGKILINNSTGTAGQVLVSGGSSAAPAWTTIATGGGTITGSTNGLTTSGVNIKFGGTLTENTTIARSTFDLIYSAGITETRFGTDFMKLTNTSFILSNLAVNPVSITQTVNGSMYFNTALNKVRVYANGSFRSLLTDEDTNIIIRRQPASYTLALTDKDTLVDMDVVLPNTLTIPNNSSVPFPIGSVVLASQYGVGQTTIVPAAGVTLRSAGGFLVFALQYSLCTFLKIGENEWYVFGDISS